LSKSSGFPPDAGVIDQRQFIDAKSGVPLAQNRNKEKTMIDFQHYSTVISNRLQELGLRLEEIDAELGIPKPADFEEQAIDIEDDEVLESLGVSAQKEVRLLKLALRRIAEKTYGTCLECAQPISKERLDAVPYAPLCKRCAGASEH
jgi:DnaK suppressor protein